MSRDARSILLQALRHVLRPTIRFCVRHSLKLQDVLLVVKQVFLEVAEEEIRLRNEQISMSKLSVISGLHRRDVAKLYSEREATPVLADLLTRVIGQWQSDRRFTSEAGRARILTAEGRKSEFFSLVYSVSQDLNPYTVLYELLRVGAIVKTSKGVKLSNPVYMPKGVLEGFQLLARDLDDFIFAVEQNLLETVSVPNLHIATQYDNVIVDGIPDLRKWLLDHGSAFHERAREKIAGYDKDINTALEGRAGGARVIVGSFSRIAEPPFQSQHEKRS